MIMINTTHFCRALIVHAGAAVHSSYNKNRSAVTGQHDYSWARSRIACKYTSICDIIKLITNLFVIFNACRLIRIFAHDSMSVKKEFNGY